MQEGIFFLTTCRNKFYNHNLGNSSRYFPFYHTMFSISERTGGAYICGNMSQIKIKNQKQSNLEKVKLQKNEWIRYRRSSKVVTKTICGSYRRPGLSSRHPHGFTQCLINYFREIQYLLLTPFGDIHGTYICLQEKKKPRYAKKKDKQTSKKKTTNIFKIELAFPKLFLFCLNTPLWYLLFSYQENLTTVLQLFLYAF